MANSTSNDFFAGPVLQEAQESEQVKTGIPWHLDKALMTPSPLTKPVGTEFIYTAYRGTQRSAQLVAQSSPSVTVELPGAKRLTQTALGTKENFLCDIGYLNNLLSGVPYIQAQARADFLRRIRAFKSFKETLRKNAIAMAVLTGKLTWINTAQGAQLTMPGTANAIVCDFANVRLVQGANVITRVNDDGTTSTFNITVPDFSNAATDIPGFFQLLNLTYEQVTGYSMRHVNYGINLPKRLNGNTVMQAYFSRNQKFGGQFLDTGEVPSSLFSVGDSDAGTMALSWHPAYMQWFQDPAASNTTTSILSAKKIVVSPDVNDSWYEFVECGTPVPSGGMPAVMAGQDIESMVSAFGNIAYGDFIYALQIMDPYAVKVISGWYGTPVIKNPLALWEIAVEP